MLPFEALPTLPLGLKSVLKLSVCSDSLKVDFYLKRQVLLGSSFSFTNESEDSYKYIGVMVYLFYV